LQARQGGKLMKNSAKMAIVEADASSRHQLKLALAGLRDCACAGFFSSADAALRVFHQRAPEIVLIGVRCIDPSSLSSLRLFKRALPALKIILLTTCTDELRLLEALDAGADGCLVKPLSGHEIAAAIDAVLKEGIPLSPVLTRLLVARLRPSSAAPPAAQLLTPRELEVMAHVASGRVDKEIASALQLSLLTVKRHLHNIYEKLGVENRVQAINRISHFGDHFSTFPYDTNERSRKESL
jgi:DNA-binding NarL/FixJ family response regulator